MARNYAGRVSFSDSEDPEQVMFWEDGTPRRLPSWRPSRMAMVAVGSSFVVCSFIALAHGVTSGAHEEEVVSARQLLEGPDMVNVATRNTMTVCRNLRAEDESFVRDTVARGLQNITSNIASQTPTAVRRLEDLRITAADKARILKVVGSMSDPRVQQIGYEVAKTVHEGKSEGREGVKRRLLETFQSRLPELRSLKGEIYETKTMGDKEMTTLNLGRMSIIKALPESGAAVEHRRLDSTGSELTSADMDVMADKFEKGLGIVAGLIEQCRVCLDQIDFVGESFGKDMKIPYWAKSLVGGLDFVSELSDCVMRSNSNEVKLMMCPMKYASAFSDFMESVDNMFGADNGHLSLFGSPSASTTVSSGWGGWGQATTSTPTPWL